LENQIVQPVVQIFVQAMVYLNLLKENVILKENNAYVMKDFSEQIVLKKFE